MILPYPYGLAELSAKRQNTGILTSKIKVGDSVKFKGIWYRVRRIDGHVRPICLGGGLRVSEQDIERS